MTKRLGALPVAAEFLRRLDVKGRKPPASAGRSPGEGYAAAPGDDHGESSPCARLRELDENCTMRR
ncbi:hypothetical protein ACFWNT_35735 [Streptomyces sp. NPDC058409]|uniref:hypothetical protein n=1 Tax=Streptomyces sp. NPDC058409 TaxID=3346484 RepID=UPI003650C050